MEYLVQRLSETEGMEDTGEQSPLSQLSKVHMNSQRRKQHAQGLQKSALGPLCIDSIMYIL